MVDSSQRQAVRQRSQYMLLTNDIGKRLWTPLAGKDLITHSFTRCVENQWDMLTQPRRYGEAEGG
ncbi:hypothetical protein GCM10007905_28520 [Mixta theicola]|nr:hypothetical protein GCM10007905_28520 [Mixta theicola]